MSSTSFQPQDAQPQGIVEKPPQNGHSANGHSNGHSAEQLESLLPTENYLNATSGLQSWLFTLDHKRIGILYLISISVLFVLGGIAASLVRFNLLAPQGLLGAEAYNRSFTAHGVIMVFFFLIPSIPAVLGNFFLPMMLGAKDVAFPKLNLMSWHIFVIGALMALIGIAMGGVDTGWTFYTPYSSLYSNGAVAWVVVGAFLSGFSSILTGLNFIVTTHKMRCPGMTWFRMPLFIWSIYATSLIQVLGTPVIAITLLLVTVEKVFKVGVFDPRLGGDPVLFQHLFWFYSHPAVYIMILPSMAVISEILTCFSRRPIFGYKFVAFSSLAIAVLSFLVWGHHLFVSSQSPYAGMVFSVLSFLVAVPSAIKVFNWTATLYKGSITLTTPMIYALCFLGLFTIGGLTGLPLAAMGTDIHLHDTYYVIAHFHYVMVGGAITAYLGGMHFWWPKMTGRLYPESWGRIAAITLFIGFNMTFLPQFLLGFWGMNRRYHSYAPEFQVLNITSSLGATIQAIGYMMPVFYLLWSLKYGEKAEDNPWHATGLEWQTPSPPTTFNFETIPVVTTGPYAYSAVEAERQAAESNQLVAEARRKSGEAQIG